MSSASTAAALTDATLRKFSKETAIILEEGRTMTFAQLRERVYRLANFLTDGLGLTKGDRVAILADNRHEYIELDYAGALTGIVKVPLYMRNAAPEHMHMLKDADARALFIESKEAGRLWEVLGQDWGPVKGRVVAFDCFDGSVPDVKAYEDCLLNASTARVFNRDIQPLDDYHIRYTSGTTGMPKGAATSHSGMLAATLGNVAYHALEVPVGLGDVMAHVMPMSHSAAFDLIGHSWAGVAHLPVAKFDAGKVAHHIQKQRVSITMTVPTMIEMLTRYLDDNQQIDISSLKTIAYGGAPISEASLEAALNRIGPVFTQGYGSTETPSLIAWLPKALHQVGSPYLRSCGAAAPFVDIQVLDDNGDPVPDGEIGEICVRSPSALTRYINQPEATAEALRGGWYHSGDLGVRDELGYLYLRDRKRDMIISGGFNIYPAEVENAIMSHPDVLQCAVVGKPDDKWGEAVSAMVTVRPGTDLSLQDIQEHCEKSLGRYKMPRHLIVTNDPLPQSGVGKVLRREVRERFAMEEQTS